MDYKCILSLRVARQLLKVSDVMFAEIMPSIEEVDGV